MSFIKLAEKAQAELEGERLRLKQLEDALLEKSSLVENRLKEADKRDGELAVEARQLQLREEGVAMRELRQNSADQAQKDLADAHEELLRAQADRRKAQDLRDESQMKLEDLEKRELALSEEKKKYKQDLELEVMRNFTGMRK